jgi:cytochrome c-type biogenesis protein CcmE
MRKSTRNKLAITGIVSLAGIVFIVYSVLANSGHYKMVDQLMAAPSQWIGKKLQVHGYVQPGTIQKQTVNQQAMQSFVLEKDGRRIRVENTGPAPDNFADQAEVIATGRLEQRGGDYVLISTQLDAKCPSKYEGASSSRVVAGDRPAFH